MSENPNNTKMDARCPRKLESLPDSFCPLAVQRLKALRHAGRELTEEEEAKLPGCPHACMHQLANYCFFSLISGYMDERKGFSDMEIAHALNISVETVKKVEKKALQKLREAESIKEIKHLYGTDKILDDGPEGYETDYVEE